MEVNQKDWDDLANYRDSLEHYGVPGMRWGVRKDRGSSGSRTSGRKRSTGKTRAATRREEREKAKAAKKAAEAKKKAQAEAAKKEAQRKKILRDPRQLYKHRDEFTYDEIKEAMKRFDWEKQLNGYSQSQVAQGAKFIGDLFTLANNSINLYNSAARIANSVGDNGPPIIKSLDVIGAEKKEKKQQGKK